MTSSPPSTRKRFLQNALGALERAAPDTYDRLQRNLAELTPRARALREALAGLPIVSITVAGANGIFEGSASDASVIQRYAVEGAWSPKTIAMVQAFFGPAKTGTYLDIGANIGLTAVPIARSGIRTIAFEPVPTNARHLRRNAEVNECGDAIEIVDVALLDAPGEVTFELSPENHGDHRFRRDDSLSLMGESEWQTIVVPALTLDSFADRLSGPVVMKIDVQGAEPLVFRGGGAVFDRVDMLICEISPYAMARMGVEPADFFAYIGGFAHVRVFERESEDNATAYSGADIVPFLTKFHADNLGEPWGHYINLVANRQ
jgi:FkbM family methyltransferase